MNPDWKALMEGGFDPIPDDWEDDAVPAGADAAAVVVTALIGGMQADALAEGVAAPAVLVERFDA